MAPLPKFQSGFRDVKGENLQALADRLNTAGGSGKARTNTAIATVGNGSLTANALVGGLITRSGSVAAFTDTTVAASAIVTALGNPTIGASWTVLINNTTAFPETIAAGSGVTLSGTLVVPPISVGEFLVTYTAAGAVSMVGLGSQMLTNLPVAQYATAALQTATMTGAQVAGADIVVFDNTGTTPGNLQMPTAAQLVAAIPNAQPGFSYMLQVRNSSGAANTATITTNTGITLTGTMTIAQTVTRSFVVTLNSLIAVTVQSIGVSAAGA